MCMIILKEMNRLKQNSMEVITIKSESRFELDHNIET